MPRVAPAVSLDPTMKAALDQLVRSSSAPQGQVQRSRIALAAAAGRTNQQITGIPACAFITPRPMLPGSIWWNVSSVSRASRACHKVFIPRSANSRNFCWTTLPITTKIPGRSYGPKSRKNFSALSRRRKNIKRRTRASRGGVAGAIRFAIL